jgi:hypothetical protein
MIGQIFGSRSGNSNFNTSTIQQATQETAYQNIFQVFYQKIDDNWSRRIAGKSIVEAYSLVVGELNELTTNVPITSFHKDVAWNFVGQVIKTAIERKNEIPKQVYLQLLAQTIQGINQYSKDITYVPDYSSGARKLLGQNYNLSKPEEEAVEKYIIYFLRMAGISEFGFLNYSNPTKVSAKAGFLGIASEKKENKVKADRSQILPLELRSKIDIVDKSNIYAETQKLLPELRAEVKRSVLVESEEACIIFCFDKLEENSSKTSFELDGWLYLAAFYLEKIGRYEEAVKHLEQMHACMGEFISLKMKIERLLTV